MDVILFAVDSPVSRGYIEFHFFSRFIPEGLHCFFTGAFTFFAVDTPFATPSGAVGSIK